MSRNTFDKSACDSLSECVKEIEKDTNAELVIVVRARSGNYRHADYLFGAIVAFIGLLFLLFLPIYFHQFWVPVDILLLFALGAFACSRSNALRRLLTTDKFRAERVRTGAAAMFYEAGIANTNAEMGILIYLSLLERRLELIADRGILKVVPALDWNQSLSELTRVGSDPNLPNLLEELRALGTLLKRHLPATAGNPNELPDLPRFD